MLPNQLLTLFSALSTRQVIVALVLVSALLVIIEERRFSTLPLLVSYILLAILSNSALSIYVSAVQMGIGVVTCGILFISADRAQRALDTLRPLAESSGSAAPHWLKTALKTPNLAGIGPTFRLVALISVGIVVYGIWQAWPFPLVGSETGLVFYWLGAVGLLVIITSLDPLRTGLGILVLASGFEILFVTLEQSLLVVGLLGIAQILLALAISLCTEFWIESLQRESSL